MIQIITDKNTNIITLSDTQDSALFLKKMEIRLNHLGTNDLCVDIFSINQHAVSKFYKSINALLRLGTPIVINAMLSNTTIIFEVISVIDVTSNGFSRDNCSYMISAQFLIS